MSDARSFVPPSDGPAAVLVRLVRRMRLPYSSVFVAGRSANHARPDSLLALVEIGAEVGLKVTAARTDAAQIEDLPLPIVVHFAAGDGEGGFGILEAVTPAGFRVWDSAHGRRTIDRDPFLSGWSGIVGLIERDDTGRAIEQGFRRNRLLELLAGSAAPPALAGSSSAPALRVATLLVIALLLGVAGAEHPAETRLAAIAMMVLVALGFAITVAMAVATGDPSKPFALPGCPRGKRVDCESVLTSPYSRILGIPLSEIGIAFYGSTLMLLATAALTPTQPAPWMVAGVAFFISIPFSLGLIALQIGMKQFCTLCMAVHAVNISCAAITLTFIEDEWSVIPTLASALLFILFFCIALFLAVPYFTRTQRLRAVVEDQQRAASSPFATLADLLTQHPRPVKGPLVGTRLEGPAAQHELVMFVHPSCAQCARTIQEARPLAEAGSVELYVAIAPKDGKGPDRAACSTLVATGIALSSHALLDAYAVAKKDFAAFMGAPISMVAGSLDVDPRLIRSHLDTAAALVGRAEELADAHVEGTPALFFDSRLYPYTAPVAHLVYLLEHHPGLLEHTREHRHEQEPSPT